MSKTAVNTFLDECKLEGDYHISDDDLTTMLLSLTNKAVKRVKNLLKDFGFRRDITEHAYFKTIAGQEYVDIQTAHIVGDVASFTAVAGDKITVTIDGTAYTTGALTGAVLVATVVTAINLATAGIGDVASEDDNGFLMITSLSSGSSSSVTIADDAGTGAARLFTVAAERTQSSITDVDLLMKLSERTNDRPIPIYAYDEFVDMYTDPSASSSGSPDAASRHNDYLYFGPTPSQAIYIYIDYWKLIADVAAGGTMPFEDKYDELLSCMVKLGLQRFLDNTNQTAIADLKQDILQLTHDQITASGREYSRQAASRRDETPYIQPRAHQ